jgi:hypothetical protein
MRHAAEGDHARLYKDRKMLRFLDHCRNAQWLDERVISSATGPPRVAIARLFGRSNLMFSDAEFVHAFEEVGDLGNAFPVNNPSASIADMKRHLWK